MRRFMNQGNYTHNRIGNVPAVLKIFCFGDKICEF
jgi:hypothetical protein